MRSRANYKGHPIHPALIPFPFAFLTGAFGFDLAGVLLDRASWWTTGAQLTLVGIATALLAAVPGIIDYFYTVPPRSSGKKRATKHALCNVGTLVLFGVAYFLRESTARPTILALALEAAGVGLLMIGGWLGGTLVSRNQISVDHRYARAGKWKEERIQRQTGQAVVIGRADELEVDQMKLIHINGRRVVLARTEQGHVAFDDHCTHRGGSLADGVMICGTVQCPWHGSQFDVRTGTVKAGPAEKGIAAYRVEETDGEIRLLPT